MTLGHFILNDDHSIKKVDLYEWAAWMESNTNNRKVNFTHIDTNVKVSTVFLGLDHNWFDKGDPILFETMIFGGPLDGSTYRYCTWDEAVEGHKKVVECAIKEKDMLYGSS